ncbi:MULTISPECIES: sensor histidine kinase [Xanthocytophaga]|uniref:Histidine kinase n=2 Tax=Xanthocytophaga TaxID=3078918 RepID=A0AAE3UAM1_9BACT|nr:MULTISPECIES: histidine kinase [Xanthocytophaga]MDJ1484862.1 histidine kinase [Xanthocytophaga flavus]MDJ1502954.1 histidine kinase [Xanthocytophaga agilis]
MFSHPYRYLFILLIAVYSYLNTLYVEVFVYYHIPLQPWEALLTFVFIVLCIWEGNRLLETKVETLQNWLKDIGKRQIHPLLILFGGSIVITTLSVSIPVVVFGHYEFDYNWQQMHMPVKLAFTLGFRINLFLNTLNAIFFFLRQQRQAQLEAERLKKISIQAQFQSLKNQVNPHFLFNNLNVLSTLVFKDPVIASEFIEELARVYRYVLQNFEKELIELSTELNFIRSYRYLLDKRFNSSLHIQINVPEQYQHHYIVPLALQMLIENAIKHNIGSRNRPLHIRIYVDENQLLVVENNLQPKLEKELSTQIGLENIAQRYQFISQQTITIQQDSESFIIRLPLLAVFD